MTSFLLVCFKDMLPFQLSSDHVQNRFLQKLRPMEMLSFLHTFIGEIKANKLAMAHPAPSPCELPGRTEVEGRSTLSWCLPAPFPYCQLGSFHAP